MLARKFACFQFQLTNLGFLLLSQSFFHTLTAQEIKTRSKKMVFSPTEYLSILEWQKHQSSNDMVTIMFTKVDGRFPEIKQWIFRSGNRFSPSFFTWFFTFSYLSLEYSKPDRELPKPPKKTSATLSVQIQILHGYSLHKNLFSLLLVSPGEFTQRRSFFSLLSFLFVFPWEIRVR